MQDDDWTRNKGMTKKDGKKRDGRRKVERDRKEVHEPFH